MEIQSISGFQLPARTVTPADWRPPTRPNRHLAAHLANRYRSPPETGTIDFRRGLETFDPPRNVKRPNSSQGQRKQISKAPAVQKDICTCCESHETPLAIQEELEAMTNADINENVTQVQTCNTQVEEGSATVECQEKVSTPSFPESCTLDPSMVCTCSEVNVHGLENKRHGDHASTQESKAWFEKTLQEYEDLKKSVEAHISSTPNERNELATDGNPQCGKLFCEEIPFQDKTLCVTDRMDVGEVYKRNGYAAKMSGLGSPTPSTYSCGCHPKSFASLPMPDLDMDAVQDAAWRKMVETVAELRGTNQALQQTVRELRERQYNSKAQTKPDSLPDQCSVMSPFDPELRKRVLGTLKNSVHRMESLMVALRDEQEKSRTLSSQLQRFLPSSKERTPQPTPPRGVSWSGSTSPLAQCSNIDYTHQLQTFSTIPPACFSWTGTGTPGQSMSPFCCSCDHEFSHEMQTSAPERNLCTNPSLYT